MVILSACTLVARMAATRPMRKVVVFIEAPFISYSTVTDFAKFRGWSTSVPFASAT